MNERNIFGYRGKILRVNLSNASISREEPDDAFYRTYFGGTGLISYYLFKELEPNIEPLGDKNKLIFSSGVITGIPCAGCGRSSVGSKSPLTGSLSDAQAGGFWPAELKKAGWDGIIIEGKAETPVYLWINGNDVEIRNASHLWGRDTAVVEEDIKNETAGRSVRVAQIGTAGEKQVRYACIFNDLTHAYGRGGHGAVMGSKNLRAIAVLGHEAVPLADSEKVGKVARWMVDNYKIVHEGLMKYGTARSIPRLHLSGMLPSYNFRSGQFESYSEIDGVAMAETILTGRGSCFACPIRCKRNVTVESPYNVKPVYGGPEYETVAALGSLCGVGDLKAIAKSNQICQMYGLDTISAGNAVAFAMECYEQGIITKKDTGGIELKFGNSDALHEMLEKIAMRDGLGYILGEGVKRASKNFGHDSEEYAMQVKGQESPLHDPRTRGGLAIGYAVSHTGADHNHNMFDTNYELDGDGMTGMKALGILGPLPSRDLSPSKVRMSYYYINFQHFKNCAVMCIFPAFNPNQINELVCGATGWNSTVWELMKVGERAQALARAFNFREGFTAADDELPKRFHQPFHKGPLKGVKIDRGQFHEALQRYYAMSGWDKKTGSPTPEKLQELDLDWVVDELGRGGGQSLTS